MTQLVQNIDYAPTILEAAGVPVPADIQGETLLPLLKGEQWNPKRDALYYHYYEYPAEHAVRPHYGVRTEQYKLIHFYGENYSEWELFDLAADKNELNNIYGQAGTEQLTDSLKAKLRNLQIMYGEQQFIQE